MHRDGRFPRSAQEPGSCSRRLHAGHRPANRQAVAGLHPGPSTRPGFDVVEDPFDTSSAVHSRSSSRSTPDAITSRLFPSTFTTLAIGPEQLEVVWSLVLQPGSEGPTLISRAAKLRSVRHTTYFPLPSWHTVHEDLAHDQTIGDQRDQLACAIAMGADEDVDGEHALHPFSPTRAGWALDLGSERWPRRRPRARRALRTLARHDEVTPLGGGRQDSVIGEEMDARARYECREA